ncbi:unnamed protein product [Spirodela intermedia]|uniref:C2H2-type domain-containing protein n=1 Tax=Spirodela intermedia TaxID=51605 RepID=A0A7I8IFI3_SPIIN|nr:unnamed protein product [Spirodela intermedia]CAA6656145.1 unnamed protein product [Spirodela intermedia]
MDRHACRLCFRRFSNGRALGGHMRSHAPSAAAAAVRSQLIEYSASPSTSSSASRGELEVTERVAEVSDEVVAGTEEDAKQLLSYGLRENPKKSFRLVDPEFSSTFVAADYASGGCSSVVVQDWESETESSVPPSLRRRSKRRRRAPPLSPPKSEPSLDPEPVSSVSDTTPDEDVARCLMMLSRDVWTTDTPAAAKRNSSYGEEEDEEEQPSDDDSEKRYQCGTCGKIFRSYQALGGHRASHKKIRPCLGSTLVDVEEEENDDRRRRGHQIHDADSEVNAAPCTVSSADRRIHECPVCFRVFSSGQALGGHKRSHLINSSSTTNSTTPVLVSNSVLAAAAAAVHVSATADASPVRATKSVGESLIDLNQPPPMDEEAELSAVSDGQQYK